MYITVLETYNSHGFSSEISIRPEGDGFRVEIRTQCLEDDVLVFDQHGYGMYDIIASIDVLDKFGRHAVVAAQVARELLRKVQGWR